MKHFLARSLESHLIVARLHTFTILAIVFVLACSLPAFADTGAAAAPDTGWLPLAVLALGALTTIVHLVHSIGLSHVVSNHLRDMAAKPGNALAPVENAIAAHIDAGDDEAALVVVKSALGAGKK